MRREEKVKVVEELAKKFDKYPTIGIFDLYKVPTKLLKEVKRKLSGKISLEVTKKNLILLALDRSKDKDVKKLKKFITLQPALIFSKENGIEIFSEIESVQIEDYPKVGDVVDEDVAIEPGATTLSAGPVIGELSRVGIPVGVEGGKIVIKKRVTVLKSGEKVTKELASALRRLDIKPMKIGIKLNCIFSNGIIFDRDILDFAKKLKGVMKKAHVNALTFAVNVGWITRNSIKYLLIKAYQNARKLDEVVK